MSQPAFTLYQWKRKDYDRLVELGAFDREPVELIGGQLIVAEPKGSYHTTSVDRVDDAFRAALREGWIVRNEKPIALDDDSEPEPDVAIVPGGRADYRDVHPGRPALVIEVADSSLAFDRLDKGSLYARGGVTDYWIVNLIDRVVEIYRDPAADAAGVYGWRYRSVETARPGAVVTPLAIPSVRIRVADLLP